jgi:large subunit ribosomal protein L28
VIKKRRFNPNMMKKRFWFVGEKRFITLNLTAHGMRKIDRVGIDAVVREMRARGEKV